MADFCANPFNRCQKTLNFQCPKENFMLGLSWDRPQAKKKHCVFFQIYRWQFIHGA